MFSFSLTIFLVHRKEHVFGQSDSPRLAVMAVPEGLRCSLIALAPPPWLWILQAGGEADLRVAGTADTGSAGT